VLVLVLVLDAYFTSNRYSLSIILYISLNLFLSIFFLLADALTFAWGCITLAPTFAPSCVGLTIIPDSSNSGLAILFATNVVARARVRVSVTVMSGDGEEGTTYMYVNVVEPAVPSVQVSTIQPYDSFKYNCAVAIKLKALIGPPLLNNSRAVWSVDDPNLLLPRLAMTQIAYYYSNSTSLYTTYFALSENALNVKSGLDRKFMFSLKCASIAFTETSSAIAKMIILVNAPPMAGSLTILPSRGQAIHTIYSLLASNWADSDFPLSYEFWIRGSYTRGSVSNYLQIQGREGNAALDAKLPAGIAGDNDALVVAVNVYDAFSATSFLEGSVSVSPGNSSDIDMLYKSLPRAYLTRSDERRIILTSASGRHKNMHVFCMPASIHTQLTFMLTFLSSFS